MTTQNGTAPTPAAEAQSANKTTVDFNYGKNKDTNPNGTTVQVYYPSVEEIITALPDLKNPLSNILFVAMTNGMKQLFRNHVNGGYPAPDSIAQIIKNEAARAEASKDKGAALQLRRDAINGFAAFITGLGVKEAAVAKMTSWLNSKDMNALAAQKEATRANIAKLAQDWIDSLTAEQADQYTKVIETIGTALQGETVDADAFSLGDDEEAAES